MFGTPTSVRARALPVFQRAADDLAGLRNGLDEVGQSGLIHTVTQAEQRLGQTYAWLGSSGDLTPPAVSRGDRVAPGDGVVRLRALADAFETLVEAFEGEDPVANAEGVQVASLAFAILGATAARIERDLAPQFARSRR